MIQNDRAAILEAFTRGFTTMPFNNSMRIELACDMADLLLPHYIDSDMPIWKTDEEGNDTYTDTAQDLFNDIYDDMLQKIDAIIGLDYSEAEPNCSKVITVVHPTMLEEEDRQNVAILNWHFCMCGNIIVIEEGETEEGRDACEECKLEPTDEEKLAEFDKATDDAIRDKLETEGVV